MIGAGSSGLVAAKNLRERGLSVDVVEATDDVGGNWYFGAPSSRVYRSTHMISSKPFTQYPDFPMPDDAPDYLHHTQVHDYLRRYTDHFGLRELIEFDTRVERVAPLDAATGTVPDAPQWGVTLSSDDGEAARRYAGVVVCNGHNWFPKMPSYPGQEHFSGEIIHSADYQDASVLTGRRVLVVGAGNTGCDIAVEAARTADAAFHSTRRGYWYAQKYTLGKPTDQFSDIFFSLGLPHGVVQRIFETSVRITIGDFERHGLKEPDHRILETHPIVNETLIHHVGHGDITPLDDIERFETDRVVLTDGRAVEVDLVVFCTGYLIRFPFLDERLLNWRDGRPRLYRNVFSPDLPNLAVVGLIQPDSGQFNLVHWQSVALARYLRAQRSQPELAERFARRVRGHVEDQSSGGVSFVESTRHYVEVEHLDYIRDLDEDINSHLRADVDDPELAAVEPVMRRLDWSFPPRPVDRELRRAGPGASDRPPVLLVHGEGGDAGAWTSVWMSALADAGWASWAVSLRGHGASGGAERLGGATLRDYVHDVLQAITELPRPPVLVGHSLGALVVERVLERYPARAGVLLAPVGPWHGLHALPELVRGGAESPVARLQAILPRRPRRARPGTPVLVVGGGDDDASSPVAAVRTARHHGTRARLVRGGGHDLVSGPGAVTAAMVTIEWLADRVAAESPRLRWAAPGDRDRPGAPHPPWPRSPTATSTGANGRS